jgi:hypothetical protein
MLAVIALVADPAQAPLEFVSAQEFGHNRISMPS